MYQCVLPCMIKYDFIGKIETVADDSKKVLRALNEDESLYPINNTDIYKEHTSELLRKYFSQFTRETLNELYEIYKYDYEAFGYKKPDFF